MKASEERFYSSQQPLTSYAKPYNCTASCFEAGCRYSIITHSLRDSPVENRDLIVELGCGDGSRLLYLKRQFSFCNSLGIDLRFSKEELDGQGGVFFPANLNQPWPIEAEACNVLIAMMLLEHLFDPLASFHEIKRVLAPSGRAFVNLPLITSFKNRLRLLSGKIPVTSVPYRRWFQEGHWDGFHLHYFTLSSIFDLAHFSGLRITKISGVGKFHSLKSLWPTMLCDEISFELRHRN